MAELSHNGGRGSACWRCLLCPSPACAVSGFLHVRTAGTWTVLGALKAAPASTACQPGLVKGGEREGERSFSLLVMTCSPHTHTHTCWPSLQGAAATISCLMKAKAGSRQPSTVGRGVSLCAHADLRTTNSSRGIPGGEGAPLLLKAPSGTERCLGSLRIPGWMKEGGGERGA